MYVQGVQERWGRGSRPIVLALSNPSEVAECTAQQAHDWSGGRAVYASGTAFPPFDTKSGRKVPAQANNSLIFPGNTSNPAATAAPVQELFQQALELSDWLQVVPVSGRAHALLDAYALTHAHKKSADVVERHPCSILTSCNICLCTPVKTLYNTIPC